MFSFFDLDHLTRTPNPSHNYYPNLKSFNEHEWSNVKNFVDVKTGQPKTYGVYTPPWYIKDKPSDYSKFVDVLKSIPQKVAPLVDSVVSHPLAQAAGKAALAQVASSVLPTLSTPVRNVGQFLYNTYDYYKYPNKPTRYYVNRTVSKKLRYNRYRGYTRSKLRRYSSKTRNYFIIRKNKLKYF